MKFLIQLTDTGFIVVEDTTADNGMPDVDAVVFTPDAVPRGDVWQGAEMGYDPVTGLFGFVGAEETLSIEELMEGL